MRKQSTSSSFSVWLSGLLAAFVGGGAGSVTTGLASMGIDPEHFNLNAGLHHTLNLMGAVFLINGIVSVCMFLKQSPIPAGQSVAPSVKLTIGAHAGSGLDSLRAR
jgi:hypothetical protein